MSNNKLNILWLSHIVPYPPKAGVLMRSHYLLKELSKHHNVDMLSFIQSPHLLACFGDEKKGLESARSALSKYVRSQLYFPITSEHSKLSRHRLALTSLVSKFPYTINWLASQSLKNSLIDKIAKNDYDLVHFDTISLAPYIEFIGDVPAILDHHNVESGMLIRRSQNEKNILKKFYYWQEGKRLLKYEQAVLKKFSCHITCSNEDSATLKDIDSDLVCKVIPNGVPFTSEFPERQQGKTVSLLFIGGLSWYPNRDAVHHFLHDIWPELKDKVKGITFDIVGKSPSEEMEEYAANDQSVKLHGFVDEIEDFYTKATVYVCPIRDGGGTKLKVIDAMAHRVPLVSYSAGCEGLEVEHLHDAMIAESPAEFANFLVDLIHNKDQAQALADRAYFKAKSLYAVEEIGEKYAKLCNETTAGYYLK